jgi:hypothetical protein
MLGFFHELCRRLSAADPTVTSLRSASCTVASRTKPESTIHDKPGSPRCRSISRRLSFCCSTSATKCTAAVLTVHRRPLFQSHNSETPCCEHSRAAGERNKPCT